MEGVEILLTPGVLENICSELTFEEAFNLQKALNLPSLNCSYTILASQTNQKYIFPRVDSTMFEVYQLIKAYDRYPDSLLYNTKDDPKIISALNEIGFRIDDKYLNWAAKKGYTSVVSVALKNGANIETTDKLGRTALITASVYGQDSIVSILLAAKANVNAADIDGDTALMGAAQFDYPSIVSKLLVAGADVNAKNKIGRTALISAATNKEINKEIIKILLDAKADVNIADKYGWTALMGAVQSTDVELTQLLILAGANVNAINQNGQNAFWLASKPASKFVSKPASINNSEQIIKILLDAGADPNIIGSRS